MGIRPVYFDHAAWDLAIATQSLANLDSDLALSLSAIYNAQNTVTILSQGIINAVYIAPPLDEKSLTSFLGAVLVYDDDMVIYEPRLLKMYDDILPRIDTALK